jgi:type II secretory pathway pseudopilin PulG
MAALDTEDRRFRAMFFFVIMLGALATALLAGWVTWRREEKARQEAQERLNVEAMEERRLRELRAKDRR